MRPSFSKIAFAVIAAILLVGSHAIAQDETPAKDAVQDQTWTVGLQYTAGLIAALIVVGLILFFQSASLSGDLTRDSLTDI
jgi:hypothetical protein